MTTHLHLIGGAGRIGTSLARSLLADPLDHLGSLSIYCDLTKAAGLNSVLQYKGTLPFLVETYSRFSIQASIDRGWATENDRHLVMLMRGVNDKKYWLTQPVDALNIQLQACNSILDSGLELYPDVQIFHFTSQFCDLIEGGAKLDEVCCGLESYRRPYMISRLHQEATLTAYAYQHSIPTHFIRLASVYGFPDEFKSSWVLNTLIRQQRSLGKLEIRNPNSLLYLVHRDPLIRYLRKQLRACMHGFDDSTVAYKHPPMLPMTVASLAFLIEQHYLGINHSEPPELPLSLVCDAGESDNDVHEHLRLLHAEIDHLLNHA